MVGRAGQDSARELRGHRPRSGDSAFRSSPVELARARRLLRTLAVSAELATSFCLRGQRARARVRLPGSALQRTLRQAWRSGHTFVHACASGRSDDRLVPRSARVRVDSDRKYAFRLARSSSIALLTLDEHTLDCTGDITVSDAE